MNQIELRATIRDDYNNKHFEIFLKDGKVYVYHYGLRSFIEKQEKAEVLKLLSIIDEVENEE